MSWRTTAAAAALGVVAGALEFGLHSRLSDQLTAAVLAAVSVWGAACLMYIPGASHRVREKLARLHVLVLALLIALFVGALVDTPGGTPYLALVGGIFLGLILGAMRED